MHASIVRILAQALALLAVLSPRLAPAQAYVSNIPNVAGSVVVHPVTHRAWFSEGGQDRVTVVDGTSIVQRIAAPATPTTVTFDTVLDRAYMPVFDSNYSLSVIEGNANNAVRLIYAAQIAGPVVVNERTHRVYGRSTRVSGQVAVYDASDNRTNIDLPYPVCSMAINERTNQLFVVHCGPGQVGASVVDLDSGMVTTVAFPGATSAGPVVVNTVTNRAYVASMNGTTAVLVIDGTTKASRVVRVLDASTSPPALAVNSANNRIYAAWGARIVVLDGASENVLAITTGPTADISNLRVDSSTNRVYGLAGYLRLIKLDANGVLLSGLALPFKASVMDLDSATQRAYISGDGAGLIDLSASPPLTGPSYQGLWWNSPAGSESGWGVDVAQQGDIVFAAWFTYDANGDPTWFVMPRGERAGGEVFSGTLYRTTGPDYSVITWDASKVTATPVGTMSLRFSGLESGTMDAVVDGTRVTKSITRQVFASPVPTCEMASFPGLENFTDIFWNPSESGWGLFLTHQGNNLFTVWFTYANGKPTWFVGSNIAKDQYGAYVGSLYRTSGPAFSASPWNPSRVTVTPIGTARIEIDHDFPTFLWWIGSQFSGPKSLRRQEFSTPRTYCHVVP